MKTSHFEGRIALRAVVAYPEKQQGLTVVQLGRERLVLVCHPQHPLAAEKSVRLKTLADQKLIGFESELPTRKALDGIFRKNGVTVKYTMEFDNVETIKRAWKLTPGWRFCRRPRSGRRWPSKRW